MNRVGAIGNEIVKEEKRSKNQVGKEEVRIQLKLFEASFMH